MRHLSEGELLDLAEGTRPETSAPHLASCEGCRRELAELRSVMAVAAEADVPEPSPLFWDHLSARVREAAAADGQAFASGRGQYWTAWRALVPIGALTALLVAGALTLRSGPDLSTGVDRGIQSATTDVVPDTIDFAPLADDASLSLLADLTSDLDWDVATEAGLAPRAGAVDNVVTALSHEERQELHRLLQEALSRSGA